MTEGHSIMVDQYGDTFLSDNLTHYQDGSFLDDNSQLIDDKTLEVRLSDRWYPVDDVNKMITRMNTIGPGKER